MAYRVALRCVVRVYHCRLVVGQNHGVTKKKRRPPTRRSMQNLRVVVIQIERTARCWQSELKEAGKKRKKLKLIVESQVRYPMVIRLFNKTEIDQK